MLAPPEDARFDFFVTAEPIDQVARFYRERWPSPSRDSWAIASGAAVEAFDGAALFDRSRLARLYGGRHPRLARGPAGEFAVLLMSPYPEADLKRLNPGTLIMVARSGAPEP